MRVQLTVYFCRWHFISKLFSVFWRCHLDLNGVFKASTSCSAVVTRLSASDLSSSVVVLEESPCPGGFSRTNFQVLVLGSSSSRKFSRIWVGLRGMRNIKHHRLAVTEWRMGGLFAIVPRSDSSSCRSHRTASQQCCCPWGSLRTNFQVLVLES